MESNTVIELSEDHQPLDVHFHPVNEQILTCSLSGDVQISDPRSGKLTMQHRLFEDSCRSAVWHCPQTSGGVILGGTEFSWIYYDVVQEKEIQRFEGAHEHGLCRIASLHENLFATADDEGIIKIWDSKSGKEVRKYHDNEDYIADFAYCPNKKTLIAAGGDGYLTVLDIRKKELLARSDNLESDLLSLSIIKGGKKVVVGMEDGVLGVFNWGDWGDVKDRIPGHPLSVDCIAKYDENTIMTGSSDGMIRVLDIYPTKFAGVIGDQGEFPVERISLSSSNALLASISHDSAIRVWNLEVPDELSDDSDAETSTPVVKKQKMNAKNDFFADLAHD